MDIVKAMRFGAMAVCAATVFGLSAGCAATGPMNNTKEITSVDNARFYVDGKFHGAVEDSTKIKAAMDSVLQPYIEDNDEDTTAGFVQNVSLTDGIFFTNTIVDEDELAEKMGYKSRSTIAKIEKGVNDVVQANIVKFSEVLNTTIAYLMGWEESIEEKPVETANKLADWFLSLEYKEVDSELMAMLKEYQGLNDTKKAQVREYVHLLSGKH